MRVLGHSNDDAFHHVDRNAIVGCSTRPNVRIEDVDLAIDRRSDDDGADR